MNYTKILFTITMLVSIALRATIIEIESEGTFNSLMADNAKPIIIKFAADWCGACQAISQPFKNIADSPHFGYITFYHVNIDKVPDLTKRYGIIGIPTFIFIDNKKEVSRESGVKNIDLFEKDFSDKLKNIFVKR